jgi:hypothetical protein
MKSPLARPAVIRQASRVLSSPRASWFSGRAALLYARTLADHISDEQSHQSRLLPGIGRMRLDLREPIQALTFLRGEYERHVVNAIIDHVPCRGTFVDAGANVGLITLAVAKRKPTVAVHAVEAHPGNAGVLRTNIDFAGASNVTVHEVALAEVTGTVHLYLGGRSVHHYVTHTEPSGAGAAPSCGAPGNSAG